MGHHIALYLDEHVQITLAEGLRLRGVDVMTTQETGNHSLCDEDQLAFALKKVGFCFLLTKDTLPKFIMSG